jgi:hypothetical protein
VQALIGCDRSAGRRAQLAHLQRLYAGARGLATGNDQLTHAALHQPERDRRQRALDPRAGVTAPSGPAPP